eukprot:m.565081 g.565081  ORF g.565081 m.565081 type:complete len:316 (-) comp22239_c4_seq4:419-1366(-)
MSAASAKCDCSGRSRVASHAGSWYSSDSKTLASQLRAWLQDVNVGKIHHSVQSSQPDLPVGQQVRCIIAPHAGYSYSGPVAAWSYAYMDPQKIKRIFLIGPSHHYYLPGCATTSFSHYATPFGSIPVDEEIVQELRATGKFETMPESSDEDEHSLEMHLPYIHHVMGDNAYTLVPMLVGSTSVKDERNYGLLLAKYFDDPGNFFIISSDFCHWGQRFRFTNYNKAHGQIHQHIEVLDKEGMSLIENIDVDGFESYLKTTQNTICGRHPISILLQALRSTPRTPTIVFTRYAQSSACKSATDSSVSYASAIVTMPT